MLEKYRELSNKYLLLIDFELMDEKYDGIDTILKFNHASHSALVTARNEERIIQNRCLKHGIKLLPKALVNFVQVNSTPPETKARNPVVLIDDDRLTRLNWANYCRNAGISFQGFETVDEFMLKASEIMKEAQIYIDSSLGNGVLGEVESERIFILGFKNLYMATGYEKNSIARPHWIKEIYSKSPENIH